MSTETSSYKAPLISGMIIKTNFKRFWPIPLISFVLLTLAGIVQEILNDSVKTGAYSYSFIRDSLNLENTTPAILFGMAVVTGIAVFHYLMTERSSIYMHALPFSRKALYLTNFLSGLLLMGIPILANTLVIIFLTGFQLTAFALEWMGIAFLICAFAFAVTALAATISGTVLMHIFNALLLNFIATFAYEAIKMYLMRYLYGYDVYNMNDRGMKLNVFSAFIGYRNVLIIMIYIIMFFFISWFAYFMYTKRPVENTGNSLVHKWIEVVLCYGITFGGMTGLGELLAHMQGSANFGLTAPGLFGMITGFIITYLLMSMFIHKTVHIFNRRNLKVFAVFAAAMIVFIASMSFDIFGFSSRTPKPSDVKTAAVNLTNMAPNELGWNDKMDYYDASLFKGYDNSSDADVSCFTFSEPANIDLVCGMHKELIKTKHFAEDYDTAAGDCERIFDYFKLKSGKTLKRFYEYNGTANSNTIKKIQSYRSQLFSSKEFKDYFRLSNLAYKIKEISISRTDSNGGITELGSLKPKEFSGFVKMYDKDFTPRSYRQEMKTSDFSMEIHCSGVNESDGASYISLNIHPSDRYTRTYLKQLGYI